MGDSPTTADRHSGPDDRPIPWTRRLLAASLLPLGLLFLRLAGEFPELVERYYSSTIFPRVRDSLRSLSAILPVPLAQVALLVILGVLALRFLRALRLACSPRRSLRNLLGHGLSRTLRSLGLLYAFFLVSWGLNHARAPYAQHAGLKLGALQQEDLVNLLEELVQGAGLLRAKITDEEFTLVPGQGGVDRRIEDGFAKLAQRVPALSSGQPLLRRAFLSSPLSYLGISGIYSPFTAEAHLNSQIVSWLQPFVSAHEIAHFKGFAREDEANFIAWQVCRSSPQAAIRYSGYLVALTHVKGALQIVEPALAARLLEPLDDALRADLDANRDFWDSKRSRLTDLARSGNDAYLKSQGQAEGVESYGRMVDLLIAEWKAGSAVGAGE